MAFGLKALSVHEQWTEALDFQSSFLKEATSQLWLEEEPKLHLPTWCQLKGYGDQESQAILQIIESEITSKGETFALGIESGWLFVKKFEIRCLKFLKNLCDRLALRREAQVPSHFFNQLDGLRMAQKQAVSVALQRPFFVLTGGPGTGKTYTARRLVQALIHSQQQKREAPFKVALLAPTGKAMVRLQQSMKGLEKEIPLSFEAMTLHRFFYRTLVQENLEKDPAAFDIILIDEASMITLSFFEKILAKTHPQTSLILMGDPYQLPPVQAMPVFKTVAALAEVFGSWVHLEECVRIENKTLYEASHFLIKKIPQDVSENETEKFKALFQKGSALELEFFPGALKWVQKIQENFPWKNIMQKTPNPYEVFNLLGKWTCLCSVKNGYMGSELINQLLYEGLRFHLMKIGEPLWVWIPVMATVNQKELERVNGEMGVVALPAWQVKQTPLLSKAMTKATQALFLNEEGQIHAISPLRLESLAAAWAMTIHKSQGSEFDHVECLFSASKHSEQTNSSLLYTACTRAKKSLRLWCEEKALEEVFNSEKKEICWLDHCKRKTEWA